MRFNSIIDLRRETEWKRVFALLPVPLCGQDEYGERAWLETVEQRNVETINGGSRSIYRPIGSDWDWTGFAQGGPPRGGGTGRIPPSHNH